jgi:phosphate transport system substrate-binding protein
MIKNNSLRKFQRDVKAVSPVVATILLVLVAVASAVAFWAILDGWQGSQSDKLNDVDFDSKNTVNSGVLKMGGSSTVAPLANLAIAAFMNDNPNALISYNTQSSGFGRDNIATGSIDIGGISDPYGSDAKDAGLIASGVVATTIGYDAVVIATNHALTPAQQAAMTSAIAVQVFSTGTITTWNQLLNVLDGNPAGDATGDVIQVIKRIDGSGTQKCFQEKVLLDKTAPVIGTPKDTNGDVVSALANDNAIAFLSYGYAASAGLKMFDFEGVTPTLASIGDNTYEAGRPLALLTVGQPSGLAKAFIDYILVEVNNKYFCEQAGYVSLY